MLRTIKQKYYAVVIPLLLVFAVGYAGIALFLQQQSESTRRSETASSLAREVQHVEREFWEIRLSERDLWDQTQQDAHQKFVSRVQGMKKQLALTKLPSHPKITKQTESINLLFSQYQDTISRLIRLKIEQRHIQLSLDANSAALVSFILGNAEPNLLSLPFLSNHLEKDYVTRRSLSRDQLLVRIAESLEERLITPEVTTARLSGLLKSTDELLKQGTALEEQVRFVNREVGHVSQELTGLFAEISKESAELSALEIRASAEFQSLFRQALLLFYLLALVILFGIVRVLTRKMIEPLSSISAVVHKVQQGDIQERFYTREKDEISQLGVAMNQMLDTIGENNQRLLAYQNDLEHKIEELAASESELRRHRTQLSEMVAERTTKLTKAVGQLENEIAQRTLVEEELRVARDAAEAANRAKSDFLANMSHELRTPLNAIIGFTELFAEKYLGEMTPAQEEYLGEVILSAQELLSLINDVLDLSHVETGKLELHPTNVPIRSLLTRSLFMVKEKASKHRIKMSTAIKGVPEIIQADERRLKQILYNLLSNALKFTPEGGMVQLTADMMDIAPGADLVPVATTESSLSHPSGETLATTRYLMVSVRDTGIGIQEGDLERIFKPFEQVDASSTRKYQGAGLGLALSKELVELHGGRIWAESSGKDCGTTLRFFIPTMQPVIRRA